MGKFAVPGSRTGGCGKGLSAGREERYRKRLDKAVESLPRFKWDEKGVAEFTPENALQVEGLREACRRFRWRTIVVPGGNGVVLIVCERAEEAAKQRQYNADCMASVGRLHFRHTPNGLQAIFEHNANRDLVHGLELLANKYGWRIEHGGRVAYVYKQPRQKVA